MLSWKGKKKETTSKKEDQMNQDRYLNLARANNNKTRIIFFLLLLELITLFIVFSVSYKTNIRTYVIERSDNDYTVLGYANDLSDKGYTPSEQQIVYFVNNFVRKSRTLSSDLVLTKKHYDELAFFLNSSANKKFLSYQTNDGYNEKINKKNTVDIEIISTLKLTKNSYQVRWNEKIFDNTGKLIGDNVLVGIYKIEITVPKSTEAIKYNPIGMLIVDISQSIERQAGKRWGDLPWRKIFLFY